MQQKIQVPIFYNKEIIQNFRKKLQNCEGQTEQPLRITAAE